MMAGKGLFAYGQSYLTKWVVHRTAVDLRVQVYEHLNRLSLDYINSKGTGRLMAHVTSDIDLFVHNVDIFGDTLIQPFSILSILVVLFFVHPPMTLCAIIVIPAVGVVLQVMGRRARRASRQRQEHIAGLSGILQETFSAGRVVRAFSMEKYEEDRLGREAMRVFRNSMKIVRVRALSPSLMEVFGAVAVLLVLFGGYFFALRPGPHQMSPAAFMTYLGMVFALYQPIRRLSRVTITINNALAGAERVFTVLDTPAKVTDAPGAEELPPFSESIEYRDVSFEYQPGVPALADVSSRIRKGETVALVGHSGAGKSTFVDLLARFYDVTAGAILVDGRDVRKVKIQSLRAQIGIVPQEVALFNDTVRNNIAYGRPDLDLEVVRHAAHEANAHEFIEKLPEGYDTVVGERGHALSGGECQRISIARALVKDPPILILDEATSSLDSESEAKIRKALDTLMRNRTTIVIAHRLSTVLHADRIIVLERGRIGGEGKHEELLRTNSTYQRLYQLQFGAVETTV
jgi:subfamily B ATP-binding cassette protein MsbA